MIFQCKPGFCTDCSAFSGKFCLFWSFVSLTANVLGKSVHDKNHAASHGKTPSLSQSYNPGKKLLWALRLKHVSPISPRQCWTMSRFFQHKRKNYLTINNASGGRGNLLRVPTLSGKVACFLIKPNLHVGSSFF